MKTILFFICWFSAYAFASSGFTTIVPATDSRLVYVSSSTGSDTNDCLSAAKPCKSLKAAMSKMRDGYPDHLYLKAGDAWQNETLERILNGRSDAERGVYASYGEGARPRISNSTSSFLHTGGSASNVVIKGLHFHAVHPESIPTIILLGDHNNVLFEDNKFDHVELILQHWEGKRLSNIRLYRNIFTGAYYSGTSLSRQKRPSNVYAEGIDGLLIEQNVFDHGGWHETAADAGANMFNHNLYLNNANDGSRQILRENIITRASSHGAQVRAGGIVEDNFFGRNAVGLLVGYSDKVLAPNAVVRVTDNVVSEGHSMIKGHDPCRGDNLCTGVVWGLDMSAFGGAEWLVYRNVVAHRSPADAMYQTFVPKGINSDFKTGTLSLKGLVQSAGDQKVNWLNNIVYKWANATEGVDAKFSSPDRTLATYNKALGGAESFDAFMQVALNRPAGTWDTRYTAAAINNYIRAGFGIGSEPVINPVGEAKTFELTGRITCVAEEL